MTTNVPLTKAEVVVAVEAMVVWRLFDSPTWLADREACWSIGQRLADLGLQQQLPDGATTRSTALGQELAVDLISVFAGYHDECEVPFILQEHGLLEETEAEEIFERLLWPTVSAEDVLRPIVQQAYRRRNRQTGVTS